MPEKAMIDALIRDKVLFRQSGNLLPMHYDSGMGYSPSKLARLILVMPSRKPG